jgi:hypothetical protein
MAVLIDTLIDSLKNEVNPPGADLYPSVSDPQWRSRLLDAFWEAKLNKAFPTYTINGSNEIVPLSGSTDLPREQQQLIVLYAGFRVALTAFQNINSQFRAKAGPVEYEVQKSANTLKALLDALRERIKQAVADGTGSSAGSLALVLDGLAERSCAISDGDLFFVR